MIIEIVKGDITKSKEDAIVNAANSSLLGGGGVDGAIHEAAGIELLKECSTLNGCKTSEAKITKGYNLLAKYVIHTVGPIYNSSKLELQKEQLKNCYINSLKLAEDNNITSIAFPSISTGIYHFPLNIACNIALNTIKEYFNENNNSCIKLVKFYLFDDITYNEYLSSYKNIF